MNQDATAPLVESLKPGLPLPPKGIFGFVLAVIAVVIIAMLSYQSLQSAGQSAQMLARSVAVLTELEAVLSTLKDAETGQRGFLLTGGDPKYLEPYAKAQTALPLEFARARPLLTDRPEQARRLELLQAVAQKKMDELESTLVEGRAGRFEEALRIVRTDRGKAFMDDIRALAADMETAERNSIAQLGREANAAAAISLAVTLIGSGVLLVLIAGAAFIASRDHRARQSQTWIRLGQMGLSARTQGDQPLERLGVAILEYLAEFLHAGAGAIFISEGGKYRRFGAYALSEGSPTSLRPGDGLIGQAVKENRALHVRDVPPGYLPITSGTGAGTANELLIMPAALDGVVQAVVELGFFRTIPPEAGQLLALCAESIAVAVRASKDRQRLEELLQETQRQSEELQAGQEELRVNNEELEEQGRALRESQAGLETQQVELEHANSQLEEQTQRLEQQKDDLARAHGIVTERSDELQRANEYKSEFLANMSHELRTPLNSTLILAKLLADNKDGNLTDQQVKFAQTISSAGNDLLLLINDVLDLSRIEAGKVELAPEKVAVAATVDRLVKSFQPNADQAHVKFSGRAEPGVPEHIETDPQRLGQILKNLLSNAFKFTAKGEVSLRVFCAEPGTVAFVVRDSGVGIAAHQQEVIFEAFRQADGSIHRKYGGTGLGLSISRDLATLLGGTIAVKSELGVGSEFTLTLPEAFGGHVGIATPLVPAASAASGSVSSANNAVGMPERPGLDPGAAPPRGFEDDRDSVVKGARVILSIEDDTAFAMILRDLVREMGFQCVSAASAAEGLQAAVRHLPSAILLDVNLPDLSGLGVLDQLKRNPQTRHIPVHMISVADYRHEAMGLGAIGYITKPAAREQLIDALRRLEAKFSQDVRHVLVVEDDARQRESIRQLLSNGDVQITAVASAADALMHLKATTFDCVVMDFNLPDLSGYDLLRKMSQQEDVAFPPVIVYTGRALSRDEEQSLRRFSKSIIIKDARSPERLLDEVTLFLHQVESKLPPERQQMLKSARNREAVLEGRRILVAEDDVRNIFALTSVLEPKGVIVVIARNGREALEMLTDSSRKPDAPIDLVLMDIMMPEMDGLSAMREIRKQSHWKNLPIIALTAKAMADDQEKCLAAGANDYIAKPLNVDKLLSLVRVWMPK